MNCRFYVKQFIEDFSDENSQRFKSNLATKSDSRNLQLVQAVMLNYI
jgi:hypothetical protein